MKYPRNRQCQCPACAHPSARYVRAQLRPQVRGQRRGPRAGSNLYQPVRQHSSSRSATPGSHPKQEVCVGSAIRSQRRNAHHRSTLRLPKRRLTARHQYFRPMPRPLGRAMPDNPHPDRLPRLPRNQGQGQEPKPKVAAKKNPCPRQTPIRSGSRADHHRPYHRQ